MLNCVVLYRLLFDYCHCNISKDCATGVHVYHGHPTVYIWLIQTTVWYHVS